MFEKFCGWNLRSVVCTIDGLAFQGRKRVSDKQNGDLAATPLNVMPDAKKRVEFDVRRGGRYAHGRDA
jgi:hypothetical protein